MTGVGYTLLVGMVPAPEPLLQAVQQIEVESSVDVASVFRVRFGISQTATGDWSVLEVDPFRPFLPVAVRVQRGLGPPEAIINGYVTSQAVRYGEDPGSSSLEVTGMDATLLMNLHEKVMPWPNMPDSGIATAIFGQYGVVPRVDPSSPVLTEPEGTTIQRGTDIRFLRRLARRNGFDCFVQPEALSGLDVGHFRAPTLVGLPEAVLSVGMGQETNVQALSVRYDAAQPTTALAAAVDPTTKAPQPAAAPASLQIPLGVEGTLIRQIPPAVARPADHGLARTPELQRSTQALVDRSTWSVVAEGTVGPDVKVLRPGGIVNIRGAGRVYSGSYYVTRVHHTLTPGRYEQRFQARRNALTMTGAELFVEIP